MATTVDRLALLHAKVKAGKRLTAKEAAFVEQARDDARYVSTLEAVASHCGVSRPALTRWQAKDTEGALVKGPKGYDLEAVARLRKRFAAEARRPRLLATDLQDVPDEEGGTESSEPNVGKLKARKVHLECEKLATQIDILRGKYALVEDVLAEVRVVIYGIKDKFRRLAPEMAYEVSGKTPAEVEERLGQYVNNALRELSETQFEALAEKLQQPQDIGEQDGRMPAARETNGRRPA